MTYKIERMILMQAATTEALSKYDQIPIVAGMLICFGLLVAYDKYLRKQPKVEITGIDAIEITNIMNEKFKGRKVELTGIQAIEVTKHMGQKLLDEITIDGSTAAKRVSNIQHKTNEALANHTDIATLMAEWAESNNRTVNVLEKIDNNMSEFYKNQTKETAALNKTILDFVLKRK